MDDMVKSDENLDFYTPIGLTVTHYGVWSTSGTFILGGPLEAFTSTDDEDQVRIAMRDLSQAMSVTVKTGLIWRARPGGPFTAPYTWAMWEPFPPERWKYIGDGSKYWQSVT